MKKDWPKRPSGHQLQEAQNKTERAIAPAAEAVGVPARQAAAPASHSALTGAEVPQAKVNK